jgi:hypothetical protein
VRGPIGQTAGLGPGVAQFVTRKIRFIIARARRRAARASGLALQLPFLKASESMGNHDSEIVDAGSVD